MTMMRPLRLMILHFSQIGLTDGLTFICPFLLEFVFSTLAAPGNASPGEIIGRNFDFDFIARIDADEVHTDLAGDLSHDFMPAGQLDAEIRVRQRLDDDAFYLDIVALGQVLTFLTRQQSLLIADSI